MSAQGLHWDQLMSIASSVRSPGMTATSFSVMILSRATAAKAEHTRLMATAFLSSATSEQLFQPAERHVYKMLQPATCLQNTHAKLLVQQPQHEHVPVNVQ